MTWNNQVTKIFTFWFLHWSQNEWNIKNMTSNWEFLQFWMCPNVILYHFSPPSFGGQWRWTMAFDLTWIQPSPLAFSLPTHHTHTQSVEFPKASQTPFFCVSDQSSLGVERDLTRGRGGGSCCLASQRCGKRQTGSFKDSQRAPSPHPPRIPKPTEGSQGHAWQRSLFVLPRCVDTNAYV